jgi:aquaporin Z
MAYAIGHISGCHLNPAVSVGLVVGKRFPASDLVAYVVAQVLGGIAAAAVLYVMRAASPDSILQPDLRPTVTPIIRPADTRWWRAWLPK